LIIAPSAGARHVSARKAGRNRLFEGDPYPRPANIADAALIFATQIRIGESGFVVGRTAVTSLTITHQKG
jgi:hypothetical protein